jgi:carbon starvation protein
VLLLLAVWGGKLVHENTSWSGWFGLKEITLARALIAYGLAASVLPIWLLLAPRDYLSTFMKLGTIFALAVGIFLVLPNLQMPALTRFVDGSGPVVAGKIFPFCFITIACGAISGFHTLIASGTTPKILTRESYARPIGYGAMCLESLVAILALIAACTLDPGVYLSMNIKGDPAATVAKASALQFPVTEEHMASLANQLGEKTLFGRTGGAATLAVGMAQIFSKVVNGRGLDLWYHFAIMFEALFILTTLDAGTRVGRYLLQDALGHVWKPLGDTRNTGANFLASVLMVAGWGYFLIQGVRDPLGGINSLWPLFGIANQMLAAIALCLGTTVILKMQLGAEDAGSRPQEGSAVARSNRQKHPALACITLVPLLWLLTATMTAGIQKIGHSDPRIGFLAQAKALVAARKPLQEALSAAQTSGSAEAVSTAQKALRTNAALHFNNLLDAAVALILLILTALIVLISAHQWWLLLTRRKASQLRETAPVWLSPTDLPARDAWRLAGLAPLVLAFLKELSVEAALDRVQSPGLVCQCAADVDQRAPGAATTTSEQYLKETERRFTGVTRCC